MPGYSISAKISICEICRSTQQLYQENKGLHKYEGKVKSSRISLSETRDKRPLGRDPESPRHKCRSKAFVAPAHATKKALH